jgi:hypothetical protein
MRTIKVLSIGKQESGDLGAKLLRRDGFYEVILRARTQNNFYLR